MSESETAASADGELRRKARAAIRAGMLPREHQVTTWGGPGSGAACAVCGNLVPRDGLGFELEFRDTDGRLELRHVHIPCFAGGSVLGWVMNQARSRAIDRLRFEGRKKRTHSAVADPQLREMTTEADAEGSEQAHVLQQALQCLTPDERQAIETAYFSELTYVEVAARLNQPLGTIKTRIRSALGKLRRALTTGANTR